MASFENRAPARGGWLEDAERLDSPHFGLRPPNVEIDLLVIHSISLPPGQYGGSEVQKLFTNELDWDSHPYFQSIRGAQVSAHFYIQRDGKLWQFVSADQRAWHAGRSSFQGRENCNDFSIGIELEGLEGGMFEAVQYQRLAKLCQHLARIYPIAHVAGHEHIAPGRKRDPGAGFDWSLLARSSALPSRFFPVLYF
jgi:N-acetyl-anhydromuramoyl-L-alanine amidase